MISSKFYYELYYYTKFGNKTTSLRTKETERKPHSFALILLLTTAYSAYAVHFFLGQFPNMELMLLLLLPLCLTELLYFTGQYKSVFDRLSLCA